MSDAGAALARVSAPENERTVRALLERQRPEIEKALPRMFEVERFQRIVFTELRRTPALYDCSPESLLGAVMLSAQLGLEPGPLGHVYLVPFRREVTFIIGYRGMIDLTFRSGRMKEIDTGVVYERDYFLYRKGSRPVLDHVEAHPDERGELVCYYALARLRTGGHLARRLWPDEVEAHRKRSPAGREGKGPWHTDYEAMARKTCVRVLAPYLPMSPEAGRALDADERPAPRFDAEGELVGEPDGEDLAADVEWPDGAE